MDELREYLHRAIDALTDKQAQALLELWEQEEKHDTAQTALQKRKDD